MANGYIGKIARINLTTGEVNIEKPDDLFYRTYIGGKGFIAYYLLKEVPADADPLGEDNKLIFACGALTGVPAAGMPRFSAGAKSPLTGAFGQSDAGGFWGPELKKAGYDGLIIEGKSPTPVYLYINDDEIRIKDAKNLWGLDTGEAQEAIRRENGGGSIKIAQIGIGGENLVRYSCIINELKHANGRNGMGAVMGSKKLKAIAVKGSGKIPFADENKIKSISKKFLEIYMDNPLSRGLYEYGTAGGVAGQNAAGLLPTRNFINGEFGGANNIGGETMADTILKKREGCYSCAIRCKRAVEVQEEGLSVDSRFGGPEYETLAAFGSLCEIDDLKIIAKANELCNRYGLDTISTGCSIAFAMECTSRGILNKEFFEGMEVTFGNSSVVLPMIEKIARREGFGDILAEGTKAAAKRIGIG
ncbi:MAG TPA: aldehyde ferredoxin oxidoreductase N-terminal domain-containing protein, partial [Bacillota bacterium]|nr:aldehyde ferredoxin oxidoreductase N-terminal domain-containing protein [Bacillota bacterium]